MNIVVDSCVLISGLVEEDQFHEEGRRVFEVMAERGDVAWAPATILWDLGCALRHAGKYTSGKTVNTELPFHIKLLAVTERLFDQTWETALRYEKGALRTVRSTMRGPDYVFLACALRKKAPLITQDKQLLAQGGAFGVLTMKPADYVSGCIAGTTKGVPNTRAVLQAMKEDFERRVRGGARR